MTWHHRGVLVLEIVIAAAVVFGVAAVAMGYGGSITHFAPDWPGRKLPEDRTLRAADVTHARFSLAFRGYRMGEVDEALDRLALEIAQRDARIEQLTGRPYEATPPTETTTVEPERPQTEEASAEPEPPADNPYARPRYVPEEPAESAQQSWPHEQTEHSDPNAWS